MEGRGQEKRYWGVLDGMGSGEDRSNSEKPHGAQKYITMSRILDQPFVLCSFRITPLICMWSLLDRSLRLHVKLFHVALVGWLVGWLVGIDFRPKDGD